MYPPPSQNMSGLQFDLDQAQFIDERGADQTEAALALIAAKCPELLQQFQVKINPFPANGGGPEEMVRRRGGGEGGKAVESCGGEKRCVCFVLLNRVLNPPNRPRVQHPESNSIVYRITLTIFTHTCD